MAIVSSKFQLTAEAVETRTFHDARSSIHSASVQIQGSPTSDPVPRGAWTWKGTVSAAGSKTFALRNLALEGWVGDAAADLGGYYPHWFIFHIPSDGNASGGELILQKTGVGSNRLPLLGSDFKLVVGTTLSVFRGGWDASSISSATENIYLNNDGGAAIKAEVTFLVGDQHSLA